MREPQEHVLTLLVDNNMGVLTRIATQLRREGLNISRLVVEDTEDPQVSKMTIIFPCLRGMYDDVLKRFRQMTCVRQLIDETPEVKADEN